MLTERQCTVIFFNKQDKIFQKRARPVPHCADWKGVFSFVAESVSIVYYPHQTIFKEHTMAYVIEADKCTNCGTCEPECPVGAISEAADKRVIEADSCISCGACAAVCPTDAIAY